MKDTCILCGAETPYDQFTHIDMRNGYIEGAGQLCASCYLKGTNREHIAVPVQTIVDTPNNMDLGAKVRSLYHQNK